MESTTEQKVNNLKIELYNDILNARDSVTYELKNRASEVLKMLPELIKNDNTEPIFPRRLEFTEEQWEKFTNFLYTCKERDLVHSSTVEYVKELHATAKIKLEILKKL